jgi:hypothetical protein
VWFKEAAPALAFEPALTAFLERRRPDCVPEVVASEGARLLTRHAGRSLRDVLEAGGPAPPWTDVVALYAEAQVELAGEVDELLELGVPDSRPETLGHAVGGPVPLGLIHEEVHGGNIHLRDGLPVFIDWAEASISHPFAGMTNTLRIVAYHSGWEPGGAETLRLRDAYLEPWAPFGPVDELRAVFATAYALGALARATTWERILSPLGPAARKGYEGTVEAWREIYAGAVREPGRLGAEERGTVEA